MRLHEISLKNGITRTHEFEKKGLCTHAVNIGTKCSHDCAYCSTGAVLRMHASFKAAGENPFRFGYALVDPTTPERVARDARRLKERGLVQLCTTVDAWAPEGQQFNLGRRCLEAILAEPGWTVRILTKNVSVLRDFDLIERYRERVLVGISITAPLRNAAAMAAVEPNASPIRDRLAVIREAHARGLRTYAMFCPLLPGIADGPETIAELVEFAMRCGAQEFFVEPVNARGPGLRLTQEDLAAAGFQAEAAAVGRVRHQEEWSRYVRNMVANFQAVLRANDTLDRLRFLLYPSRLSPHDAEWLRHHGEGVRWLGDDTNQDAAAGALPHRPRGAASRSADVEPHALPLTDPPRCQARFQAAPTASADAFAQSDLP